MTQNKPNDPPKWHKTNQNYPEWPKMSQNRKSLAVNKIAVKNNDLFFG